MRKYIYFNEWHGFGWPDPKKLEPYFVAPPGKEWTYATGNDNWGVSLEGIEGNEDLPVFKGRKDIKLSMWGYPGLGVLLQFSLIGGGVPRQDWFSKGDLTKLKKWVRSLHDTPLPVGLFVPFPVAWLAVKEFMETEGQLPTSIQWVRSGDLPDGTFPDP